MEDGQSLLAAVVERPLREVLGALEALVTSIEHPEEAEEEYGADELSLAIDLDLQGEVEAVTQWMQRQGRSGGTEAGFSWTSLAAAFFLGRWTGGK